MDEYIDLKALIYAICTDTQPFYTGSVMRAINDQPAADVVPVGSWCSENKYRCKNCRRHTRVNEVMEKPIYQYCPYCGAKMDG